MLKKVSKYDGEKLTTYLIFLNYIITYFLHIQKDFIQSSL